MGLLLYSSNAWISWYIKKTFYNDVHFVWCCDYFDTKQHDPNSAASLIAPSSCPANLCRRLWEDVKGGDTHSGEIARIATKLKEVATNWWKDGDISEVTYKEIFAMIEKAQIKQFRPMLYIIPRGDLGDRIETVPMDERANIGPEYRIKDLRGSEFEMLEMPHA